jgi:signal transduction histidine kinase
MPTPAAAPDRYLEDVVHLRAEHRDPVALVYGRKFGWVLDAVRVLVLAVVLATLPLAKPRLGVGPTGTALAIALGVAAISYVAWLLSRRSEPLTIATLGLMAISGGVLAGLSPLSTAIAIGCVVTSSAGARLDFEKSLALTSATVATFLAAGLASGAPAETLLGYPLTFIGLWAFGLTRHSYLLRAEQAEQTLAETQRAGTAEAEAAALVERARIAREIHDVLAHSLAAVSVNLEAAEGLLSALPENPELAKAIECIGRAGVFTREGLADARRAILALRDNAAPLPDQLSALAREYSVDSDAPVEFTVTGDPRSVAAEAGLAAYRTAQEALTNARKHAPGQPVRLNLAYSPREIAVRVVNPIPAGDAERHLAATGAGYGLTGLRERAALGGGTLTAGPSGGEWQLTMKIPA